MVTCLVQRTQSIAFPEIGTQCWTNSVILEATASSGLEVEFQVLDGPGIIEAGTLRFTGIGTVTVEAVQPGNEAWSAAVPVMQNVTAWGCGVWHIYRRTGAPMPGARCILQAGIFSDRQGTSCVWTHGGVQVATGDTLDIAALRESDFGIYTVTVSNAGCVASTDYELAPAPAGTVISWGADAHGRADPPEGLTGVVQIASGMNFNLALLEDGTVRAWGYNEHGGCDVPEGLDGVTYIAAGGYGSSGAGFAVKRDGSVTGWGRSYTVDEWGYWEDGYWDWDDEAEDEFWIEYDEPVWYGESYTNGIDLVATMPPLSDVVQVAVGGECAIALKGDGTVVSWGPTYEDWYWDDELEEYIQVEVRPYAAPAGLSNVVQVAAGSRFLMALTADGTVTVWNDGDDWYGECEVPEALEGVTAVAAGKNEWDGRACFALLADGTIVKWGDRYDCFGMGERTPAGAVAMDAGQEHLAALDGSGAVRIWTDYDQYKLHKIPEFVSNAVAVAAGGYHCSVIVPDRDGDGICDAEEEAYGRDPDVWESPHRSSVSGSVVCDGTPLGGVCITLHRADGAAVGRTMSDESGHYEIQSVLSASYTAKATAETAVDAWWNGGESFAVGDEGRTDIDFALEPGQGPAHADVTDAEGAALPDGAIVYLDMLPVEVGPDGTIDLGEATASREVWIDGMGQSNSVALLPHQVTVWLPGDNAVTPAPAVVNGSEGECVDVPVDTEAETGSARIVTDIAGADVYIDYADQCLGLTPLTVGHLAAGSHTLLLKKEGWLRPRPVVLYVEPDETTEVDVPLHTAAETNEMTVTVSSALPDQEIWLDYLPTGQVTPARVGGMDPASHAGAGWYSASHSILLRHPLVRPYKPRAVPEPVYDEETGTWNVDSVMEVTGPQFYDDSNGNGIRDDIEIANGGNPMDIYTYAEALDTVGTDVIWTSGGDRRWIAERTNGVPTGGWARSGRIGNGQSTWIEAEVRGAGMLSFKWKVSCEDRLDGVLFAVDGVQQSRITGEKDWRAETYVMADVTNHVFRWTYEKSASGTAGDDAAWLDEVAWTPNTAANSRLLTVEDRFGVSEPAAGEYVLQWGDEVAVSVPSAYSNGSTRAVCTGWTGTGSAPATGVGTDCAFRMGEDSSVAWNWNVEHKLDLIVSGDGVLDHEGGWISEGSTVIVSATPGLHQKFVRWEGDVDGCLLNGAGIRVPMTSARAICAVFEPIMHEVTIQSEYGEITPTNGTYAVAEGTVFEASAPEVVDNVTTQYVCTGWTGTGSAPASGTEANVSFMVLEDSSVTWNWQTNYLMSVTVVGDGTVDVSQAWVEAGSNIVVTVLPNVLLKSVQWSGDTEGTVTNGMAITLPGDRARAVTVMLTALDLGTALEQPALTWTTGGDALWMPVVEGAYDGVDAAKSGMIASAPAGMAESWIETSFTGGGEVGFWWKLNAGQAAAGVDLYVDGVLDEDIYLWGSGDWSHVSFNVPGGEHDIQWVFWTDAQDPAATALLDMVSLPGSSGETMETAEHHVPYEWLDVFGGMTGTPDEMQYENAAEGMAANGFYRVWECYVLGLDPRDENARFLATLRFENGEPVIEWLRIAPYGTDEEIGARNYVIEGVTDLGDEWRPATQEHRFFRVRVKMADAPLD